MKKRMSEELVDPWAAGELLLKFPDRSVLDFDYSQSSIWSPLIRRPFSPIDLDLHPSSGSSLRRRRRKKKKLNCCGLNLFNLNFKRNQQLSDFSPIPPSPTPLRNSNKGCGKVLKAAAKHFKKKSKKKVPKAHVKLSTYFMMDPI